MWYGDLEEISETPSTLMKTLLLFIFKKSKSIVFNGYCKATRKFYRVIGKEFKKLNRAKILQRKRKVILTRESHAIKCRVLEMERLKCVRLIGDDFPIHDMTLLPIGFCHSFSFFMKLVFCFFFLISILYSFFHCFHYLLIQFSFFSFFLYCFLCCFLLFFIFFRRSFVLLIFLFYSVFYFYLL